MSSYQAIDDAIRLAGRSLSPAGQALLRRGQEDWLQHADRKCADKPEAGSASSCFAGSCQTTAAQCFDMEYGQRLIDLRTAAERRGSFVISRVEKYTFIKFPADQAVGVNTYAEDAIAYPRIDQPDTAQTRRWNELISNQVEELAEAMQARSDCASISDDGAECGAIPFRPSRTDRLITYQIASAQDSLVSICLDYSWTPASLRNPSYRAYMVESRCSNILLKTGETLTPGQVFTDLAGAQRIFQAGSGPMPCGGDTAMASTENWRITMEGVGICNPYDVTRWYDLRKVLRADLPFQIDREPARIGSLDELAERRRLDLIKLQQAQ